MKQFWEKRDEGFTLIEIMIVVLIIAILVMIAIAIYGGSSKKAELNTCKANRRSLSDVISTRVLTENTSLATEFTNAYTNGNGRYRCPAGGTYTLKIVDAGHWQIVCSVHGEEIAGGSTPSTPSGDNTNPNTGGGSSGGDSGGGSGSGGSTGGGSTGGGTTEVPNTYPGTDIKLTNNYWPKPTDFAESWSVVSRSAGGVFQYDDGNYYVLTKNTQFTKDQAASGPSGVVYGWYNVQKLTGRIVTFQSGEQKSDLKRGDLCKIGSDYYVFVDGGSYGFSPTQSPNQWYKIPQ